VCTRSLVSRPSLSRTPLCQAYSALALTHPHCFSSAGECFASLAQTPSLSVTNRLLSLLGKLYEPENCYYYNISGKAFQGAAWTRIADFQSTNRNDHSIHGLEPMFKSSQFIPSRSSSRSGPRMVSAMIWSNIEPYRITNHRSRHVGSRRQSGLGKFGVVSITLEVGHAFQEPRQLLVDLPLWVSSSERVGLARSDC